uniref:Uncharacterized protein n=2 Tax=Epichloe TaxID=5112 RepID=A0A1J0D0F7_EPINE|nr:hypothetical protein [Epichloe festucae]APB96841.1 hypothetical protein [Epichloe festucae]APB96901.1 hypothetical protein [Epichloe hybrida]
MVLVLLRFHIQMYHLELYKIYIIYQRSYVAAAILDKVFSTEFLIIAIFIFKWVKSLIELLLIVNKKIKSYFFYIYTIVSSVCLNNFTSFFFSVHSLFQSLTYSFYKVGHAVLYVLFCDKPYTKHEIFTMPVYEKHNLATLTWALLSSRNIKRDIPLRGQCSCYARASFAILEPAKRYLSLTNLHYY